MSTFFTLPIAGIYKIAKQPEKSCISLYTPLRMKLHRAYIRMVAFKRLNYAVTAYRGHPQALCKNAT